MSERGFWHSHNSPVKDCVFPGLVDIQSLIGRYQDQNGLNVIGVIAGTTAGEVKAAGYVPYSTYWDDGKFQPGQPLIPVAIER